MCRDVVLIVGKLLPPKRKKPGQHRSASQSLAELMKAVSLRGTSALKGQGVVGRPPRCAQTGISTVAHCSEIKFFTRQELAVSGGSLDPGPRSSGPVLARQAPSLPGDSACSRGAAAVSLRRPHSRCSFLLIDNRRSYAQWEF